MFFHSIFHYSKKCYIMEVKCGHLPPICPFKTIVLLKLKFGLFESPYPPPPHFQLNWNTSTSSNPLQTFFSPKPLSREQLQHDLSCHYTLVLFFLLDSSSAQKCTPHWSRSVLLPACIGPVFTSASEETTEILDVKHTVILKANSMVQCSVVLNSTWNYVHSLFILFL